jgi:HSP20 family protein
MSIARPTLNGLRRGKTQWLSQRSGSEAEERRWTIKSGGSRGNAGMTPVYTEYNIGNFHRRFSLSNKVDASKIRAEMRDGLLTLTIPKSEEAKAQRIEIS